MTNRNQATLLTAALIGAALSILDDKTMPCTLSLKPGPLQGKGKKAMTFSLTPSHNGKAVTDATVLNDAKARVASHVEAQNTRQASKLVAKDFRVSLAEEVPEQKEEQEGKVKGKREKTA